MIDVSAARDKMMKLFEEFEATELRLDYARLGNDKGLIEKVQNQYDLAGQQFNEAWDSWNEAMSKERIALMTK